MKKQSIIPLAVGLLLGFGVAAIVFFIYSDRSASPRQKPSLPPKKTAADRPKLELKILKFADYAKVLEGYTGKIVVTYLWGDYSAPDRVRLEDVSKMHDRFARKPVAFITVCHSPEAVGDREKLKVRRAWNLKYLKKAKAARLKNVLLDERDDVWETKLTYVSGPTFIIYDQEGEKLKEFSLINGIYEFEEVEKFLNNSLANAK